MVGDRLRFVAGKIVRTIWFRPVLYVLLTMLMIVLAPLLGPVVPEGWTKKVDKELVQNVLSVMTASMLPVAIFSVTVMVQQLNATESTALPRTRKLLSEDGTAHNAISTFIGAFLFGLLGTIGLGLGIYTPAGTFAIFLIALVLIAVVVVNLILWIRRLSSLGSVAGAIRLVEEEASRAYNLNARQPWNGGRPAEDGPREGHELKAPGTGFVQSIDVDTLQEIAERLDTRIRLVRRTGSFVDRTVTMAVIGEEPDQAAVEKFGAAIIVGEQRDYIYDPFYGTEVISQIGSRALSPGINDPGTAIDVVSTLTRLLDRWRGDAEENEPQVQYDRVFVPALDPADALDAAFHGIARDGAGMVEVGVRIQQALGALARLHPDAFEGPARRLAARQLDRARAAMPDDAAALERLAEAMKDAGHADADDPRA